ncbi:MAG: thiamine pyrophosphate-requiring protein [Myxococcota bacterium]
MAQSVADFVLQRLGAWNVPRVFGYPGDGINGFMGAFERAKGGPRFLQARHEELAAFMACAHAKFTGDVGVCMATSGPGAIHLLNGLYDAQMDHQPVVAIVGQQARNALGSDYQQEVDLHTLFKDVAHHYCEVCTTPAQARQLVDRALRIAIAERTVTCLIFPNDVQELTYEDPPRAHGSVFTGVGYTAPRVVPERAQLERAADILNAGEKVAMLVGAGALRASREVRQVAELLGAGVAKALLGKAVLPDDVPWVTGAIGLLGTRPSYEMMKHCDTLFLIGTSFPYAEWLPEPGQARAVQIDIKPRMLSARYPVDEPLQGDATETLQALIPLLQRKDDRSFQEWVEREVRQWWKVLEARADEPADPINPQYLFRQLSPRLPDRAILTADSGSGTNWWARDLRIRDGMMASLSGNLATMGPAMPYGLAAKHAYPDRPVIAFVGDGAMQMNGNNVLINVARDWHEWDDPRFVVVVLNNRDLNQVTWEQRVMAGDPRFQTSQDVPAFSYARYAELVGLEGIEIKRKEDVVSGLEEALRARRPVVVDAWTDPAIAPLPPHISVEQAREYLTSMLKGDVGSHVKRSFQQVVASILPGKG